MIFMIYVYWYVFVLLYRLFVHYYFDILIMKDTLMVTGPLCNGLTVYFVPPDIYSAIPLCKRV